MIKVAGLSLHYGEQLAVDNLDVTVPRGQVLVLLGPSGCGKTSAMRCVAGLERPTAGSIVIDGRPVFDSARRVNVSPHRRNIGMVFQSYAIWPHLTVFENVAFSLKMKSLPAEAIDKRVGEALAMVGMSEMSGRGASLLSGGQMQRVALARSLVMEPAVLLLDEPLSNLDARLRDRLRMEMRQIQQRLQMTWIYVTHDQSEAFALADSVAVMQGGRIVQLGSPADIYGRPATAAIAEFVGVRNVLACTLGERRSDDATAQLDGTALAIRGLVHGATDGPMRACIRAEDLRIAPIASGEVPGANHLPAQVLLASFQGGSVNYRMELQGGVMLDVVRPRSEARLESGESVMVVVPAEDVSIIPAGVAF